jgi:hypothetical protein
MDRAHVLERTLALLAGELHDASGVPIAASGRAVRLLADAADPPAALAAGARLAVTVPPPASGGAAAARAATRLHLAAARRTLARAGATRIRTLAVVPGHDDVFAIYELGGTVQRYVETRMLLQAPQAGWRRAARAAFRAVTGVDAAVALIVVIGERR